MQLTEEKADSTGKSQSKKKFGELVQGTGGEENRQFSGKRPALKEKRRLEKREKSLRRVRGKVN